MFGIAEKLPKAAAKPSNPRKGDPAADRRTRRPSVVQAPAEILTSAMDKSTARWLIAPC
jgi:hypothetical protein